MLHFLANEGLLEIGVKVRTMTMPDEFYEQDKPEKQIETAGLDAKGIVATALRALGVLNEGLLLIA